MTAWKTEPLDRVVDLRRGFDLPHGNRVEGQFPILTSGGIGGFHSESRVIGPGLTIGRATNLGQPTWSESDYWPLNTTLYAANFYGNEPRWVFHLFESMDLTGYDSGSVQPMLNRNYIAKTPVRVPPLPTQRAISEVLGALDTKIAANTALAGKVDELASARFRAALDGSVSVPLVSLARFVNGRAFTKGASGHGRVVIRIAELNSGIGNSTIYNDLSVAKDHEAKPGDLLFAWSGSLTLHRWFRDEGIINQHIFKVIPINGVPMWLAHQTLIRKLDDFRAIAAGKATTMGHIQRRHLEAPVAVPRLDEIERINSLMTTLWQKALAAEKESVILAELRDTLLPHLMSGRLHVKDAERQVEGVV